MTKAPHRQTRIHSIASCTQKTLLPLFAVGGSLAAAPGNALELGDATVQSRLGQPLRASIAYALAPNESLAETCVSVSQGQSPSGLPGIGRATISIVDGTLLLKGSTPIREPMVATNVVVKCPSTAKLSREYMMFIDPPGLELTAPVAAPSNRAANTTAAATAATRPTADAPATVSQPAAAAPATQRAAPRQAVPATTSNRSPVGQATRYQVQPGDSLSEITHRIENRSMPLWPAVNLIFEANPEAFIDNDPNKLKAGSWLTIPSFDGSQPVVATVPGKAAIPTTTATAAAAENTLPADTAAPGEWVAPQQPVESAASEPVDVFSDLTADLQPADAVATAENAATGIAANETVAIPDVELQGPQTPSTSPNITTAAISAAAPDEASSSWLLWLAGLGVAVILALLLFGRSLRQRFSSGSFADDTELPLPAVPARPRLAPEPDGIEVIERVDWNLSDDSPTAENPALTLDADLVMGTGLGEATDNSQINEIGFPAPTEVDIELPLEAELSDIAEAAETVEMPAPTESGEYDITIESQELQADEDDDLSGLEDSDELLQAEDDDLPELETIEVEPIDENLVLNDNTVDPSIAFDILEQDYEDELSATQALSKEVAQAAIDLTAVTKGLSEKMTQMANDEDATAAMSVASLAELDFATTDENDMAANDDATTEFSPDDPTVEMPSVDDDKTEIMPRKRRKIDSKAG